MPLNVLPLHHREFLYHLGCLCLTLEDAVHTDTLKSIEQEVRIDLALQCQELGILSGEVTLLLPEFLLIDSIGKFIIDINDPVVV